MGKPRRRSCTYNGQEVESRFQAPRSGSRTHDLGHVSPPRGLGGLRAFCLDPSLCLKWPERFLPHLMYSSVVSCTISFVVSCLKKTKRKSRKENYRWFLRSWGSVVPFIVLVPNLCLKSQGQESTVGAHRYTPFGCDELSTKRTERGSRLYWGCFQGQCLMSVRFLKAWQCLKGWEVLNIT